MDCVSLVSHLISHRIEFFDRFLTLSHLWTKPLFALLRLSLSLSLWYWCNHNFTIFNTHELSQILSVNSPSLSLAKMPRWCFYLLTIAWRDYLAILDVEKKNLIVFLFPPSNCLLFWFLQCLLWIQCNWFHSNSILFYYFWSNIKLFPRVMSNRLCLHMWYNHDVIYSLKLACTFEIRIIVVITIHTIFTTSFLPSR